MYQEEHIPFILRLTGLSRSDFNTLFFEQGIEYLKREANYDEWGVNMISQHPMFWAWWKNIWHNKDCGFVFKHKHVNFESLSERGRRNYNDRYRELHHAANIEFRPPKFIISEAYEKLIIELSKKNTNVEDKS